VFRRLGDFIGRDGRAADQLAALKPALRNHALDAVGVGVFTALRPEQATRIGGSDEDRGGDGAGDRVLVPLLGVSPRKGARAHVTLRRRQCS
jgi:hypothetical protein